MRLIFLTTIAATGALFADNVDAGVSATTGPAGFISVVVHAGEAKAMALPLNSRFIYAAAVSAVDNTTLQTASAGWSVNAYGPFASNPHIVRILSGASKGREFPVASNTADTMTLVTDGSDLTASVSAGDEYAIIPACTLQSVFGADAVALNRNTDPARADNVLVRGSFGWLTYYHDGAKWLREGGGDDSEDSTALLPQNGFLFLRRGTTDLAFALVGAVPITNLKAELRNDRSALLSNRFPVATTLDGLRLAQTPGWNSSVDPAVADNVLVRASPGWITYFHNGRSWIRQDTGQWENAVIPISAAVLVVRRGGADITVEQQRPF